jgi:hypothetical protein
MKRALIDRRTNTVVQVESGANEFPVAVDYEWVDCPDGTVAYQWTFDGRQFSPPPPPSAAEQQAALERRLEQNDLRALRATRELLLDATGAKPLAPAARTAAIASLRAADDAADVLRAQLPHASAV